MQDTTAIILAGGKSSRMGQDKGLMDLNGIPMVGHILNAVECLTNHIIIIANNEAYNQFGFPVFADVEKGKGPLGGIVTGLSVSTTELNWVLSCDAPYVSCELLVALMDGLKNSDAVVPKKDGKLHPLIAAYRKTTLEVFERELSLNHLKLMQIIDKFDVQIIDANRFDQLNFKNINSKADI